MPQAASSLVKSIFLGLVTTYSLRYNRRRTEDITYALWTSILAFLTDGLSDAYLTCPQYGLYVLPSERAAFTTPADVENADDDASDYGPGDTSMRTEAGSGAEGVYLDLCLLLPCLELRQKTETSLSQFMNKLSFGTFLKSYTAVWVRYMQVPLIMELKKPPSRNPTNIRSYVTQIDSLVGAGTTQAEAQAHCLFSSRKYKLQGEVILIAGSGEWWRCKRAYRDEYRSIFSWNQYVYLSPSWINPVLLDCDDDDSDLTDEFVAPAAGIGDDSIYEALRQELESEEAQKRTPEEQVQDRTDRAARRNARAETREEAKTVLKDLIAEYADKPFTDKALEECWRLDHAARGLELEKPFLQSLTGKLTSLPDDDWTSYMRLGTPVSGAYLKYIKKKLKTDAKTERKRRMDK